MSKLITIDLPPQVEEAWPDLPPLGQLLVSVQLTHAGLRSLRNQIDRDINAKGRGISPIPFTVLELLDFERLLRFHPSDRSAVEGGDNILMTHDQRKLLAVYASRYYQFALEGEDETREAIYLDCLDALTTDSTLLRDLYLTDSYGFYPTARPLVLLLRWLSRVFTGRGQRQFVPFQPAY